MATTLSMADLAANLLTEEDFDETALVVKSGSTVIYALEIDNEANTVASYAKFYNATSATIGTTVPDMVVKVPAGEKITLAFPQGLTFATGLTVGCVTVGGTTGTDGPANSVTLEAAYT